MLCQSQAASRKQPHGSSPPRVWTFKSIRTPLPALRLARVRLRKQARVELALDRAHGRHGAALHAGMHLLLQQRPERGLGLEGARPVRAHTRAVLLQSGRASPAALPASGLPLCTEMLPGCLQCSRDLHRPCWLIYLLHAPEQ